MQVTFPLLNKQIKSTTYVHAVISGIHNFSSSVGFEQLDNNAELTRYVTTHYT